MWGSHVHTVFGGEAANWFIAWTLDSVPQPSSCRSNRRSVNELLHLAQLVADDKSLTSGRSPRRAGMATSLRVMPIVRSSFC